MNSFEMSDLCQVAYGRMGDRMTKMCCVTSKYSSYSAAVLEPAELLGVQMRSATNPQLQFYDLFCLN